MSVGKRMTAIAVGVVVVVALITFYIATWVTSYPPSVQASQVNGQTTLTLQTVASYGHNPHPDWVSYLVKNSKGQWVHSTMFDLPANTLVHVTIYNFDGDSGLRNPFWSKPRGMVGPYMVNGKPVVQLTPGNASHTFAVPDLGLSIPIKGVDANAPNQCTVAPCTLDEAHNTITFVFRTGKPGHYRWQCFVPCAAGWLNAFGGPMQTVGWMGGYLNVT